MAVNKEQAFNILANSNIPFAFGQSNIYAADCAGLVSLYFDLQGIPFSLKGISRRTLTMDAFVKHATRLGLEPDPEGDVVIFTGQGVGHCGLTDGKTLIYQDNVSNTTAKCKLLPGHLRFKLQKRVV